LHGDQDAWYPRGGTTTILVNVKGSGTKSLEATKLQVLKADGTVASKEAREVARRAVLRKRR
jgi:hypothetical protein